MKEEKEKKRERKWNTQQNAAETNMRWQSARPVPLPAAEEFPLPAVSRSDNGFSRLRSFK
jgi:hypothetical protein